MFFYISPNFFYNFIIFIYIKYKYRYAETISINDAYYS